MSGSFQDLTVYNMAYQLAMDIFKVSKTFPKEEIYSLTDQIRRSSRSVCANIAESYRKRMYPKHFVSKVSTADGECSETLVWIEFAHDCGYIPSDTYQSWKQSCAEIGKMLGNMVKYPEKFLPKVGSQDDV